MALGRLTLVPRTTTGDYYPAGQVTVYAAGTTTLATLYADDAGTTPAGNPHATDQDTGQWSAVAEAGVYDLLLPDGTVLAGVPVAGAVADGTAMTGTAADIADAAEFDDLAAATDAYNALLAALRDRSVLATEGD